MSVLTSEAVVLRTWPVHEADLIVSFFHARLRRVRGVAKSALKSRKRFGGALEPMTVARAWFAERPRQELVRLDQLEILRSPLSAPGGRNAHGGAQLLRRAARRGAARSRSPGDRLPAAALRARPDHGSRAEILDAAHLLSTLDDAPDGPAAGLAHCTACREALRAAKFQLQ
jgi:recombinational DNA repair protein (RecF pathway)